LDIICDLVLVIWDLNNLVLVISPILVLVIWDFRKGRLKHGFFMIIFIYFKKI
jgi:hypothetical protein